MNKQHITYLILILTTVSCNFTFPIRFSLKTSFPKIQTIQTYDPAEIQTAPQFTILEHLYSTLLTYNNEGKLTPALATDFGWSSEKTIYFKLPTNLKTSKGEEITVEDIRISINRALFLNKSTHGQLSSVLAINHNLTNIEEAHPSIKTDSTKRTIYINLNKKAFFIFSLFANMDFAIIPKNALSKDKTKIIDYTNTTGHYSYKEGQENLFLTLVKNLNHFQKVEKSPKEIKFIISPTKASTRELIEKGKVDFVTTDDIISEKDLKEISKKYPNSTYHETWPIKLSFISYTKKGISHLNKNERNFIFQEIREHYYKNNSNPYLRKSNQFFPHFSEGFLNQDEISQIKHHYQEKKFDKVFTLAVEEHFLSTYQEFFKDLPWVKVVAKKKWLNYYKEQDDVDAFTLSTDSGYIEDISLVSYSVKSGFLGIYNEAAKTFLHDFMNEQNKEIRIKMIKKVHKTCLEEAKIIPLAFFPYRALALNGLKMNFSKFYSNTHLWKVYRK